MKYRRDFFNNKEDLLGSKEVSSFSPELHKVKQRNKFPVPLAY